MLGIRRSILFRVWKAGHQYKDGKREQNDKCEQWDDEVIDKIVQ